MKTTIHGLEKPMSRRQLGWIAVATWGVFVAYNALFQWLAIGLNPKILYERGISPEAVNGTLAWKAREFLVPVWLNNGYIWSALVFFGVLSTLAWWYRRHRDSPATAAGEARIVKGPRQQPAAEIDVRRTERRQ
jgi:hypothetical protein